MSEKAMRERVIRILREADYHVCAHEDVTSLGVPDVSYGFEGTSGWLELKHLDKWPARHGTIVRMKRYTDEQRRWILERGRRTGQVYLLLQVEQDWYLFGHAGAQLVGRLPRRDFRDIALHIWPTDLPGLLDGNLTSFMFEEQVRCAYLKTRSH